MARLNGILPKDNRDGLSPFEPLFVNDKEVAHVVLVALRTASITENVETGGQSATMKISRIERLRPQDATLAEAMMRRAIAHRSGPLGSLDFKVKDEISQIFEDAALDHMSGELVHSAPAAWADVVAERATHPDRGWTSEHDDTYGPDHLLQLAKSRIAKKTTTRREMVEAGALILAAIEASDRAEARDA